MVANWFPVRRRSSSKPRKRAALGRRFGVESTPTIPRFRVVYTHAALFLSTCTESASEYTSETCLWCATHIVEDIDDNQDRHASIQLK